MNRFTVDNSLDIHWIQSVALTVNLYYFQREQQLISKLRSLNLWGNCPEKHTSKQHFPDLRVSRTGLGMGQQNWIRNARQKTAHLNVIYLNCHYAKQQHSRLTLASEPTEKQSEEKNSSTLGLMWFFHCQKTINRLNFFFWQINNFLLVLLTNTHLGWTGLQRCH